MALSRFATALGFLVAAASASNYDISVRTPAAGARIVLTRGGLIGVDVRYTTPLVPFFLSDDGATIRACVGIEGVSQGRCREVFRSDREETTDFAFDISNAPIAKSYTLQVGNEHHLLPHRAWDLTVTRARP
eukprot:scaffold58_cov256-Pinguiococcus_pyrenoidosus.AAC.9